MMPSGLADGLPGLSAPHPASLSRLGFLCLQQRLQVVRALLRREVHRRHALPQAHALFSPHVVNRSLTAILFKFVQAFATGNDAKPPPIYARLPRVVTRRAEPRRHAAGTTPFGKNWR
jgi:hypothetical protein